MTNFCTNSSSLPSMTKQTVVAKDVARYCNAQRDVTSIPSQHGTIRNLFFGKIRFKIITRKEGKMTVTVAYNNPYFLQFFKNSGRIFVNATKKNLTHRGGTTSGMTIIMTTMVPHLITVDALVHTTIKFKIYNHT